MAQIDKIRFASYKKFSGSEEMKIRPVTVLVGKNSSGKSSITRLFPAFANSLSSISLKSPVMLQNNNITLAGSYRNLAHNGFAAGLVLGVTLDNSLAIDIDLVAGMKGDIYARNYFIKWKGEVYELKLKNDLESYSCEQLGNEYKKSDLSGFIHKGLFSDLKIDNDIAPIVDYIGPLRSIPMPFVEFVSDTDYVGADGKNAYSILCLHQDLAKKVSDWFDETLGCQLVVKSPDMNSYQIMVNKPYMGEYDVNIAEEGMGVGQVLPIVTRCLKAVSGSVVVVEQPELHLHPAAHANIARLFATTSKQNNQRYVVETHSQNFLLGLRDAVVDKDVKFTPDDVIIYFVDEDENGSYLSPIEINSDGTLTDWPTGVFNETHDLIVQIMKKSNNQ